MAEENARIAMATRCDTLPDRVQQEYISSLMDEDSVVNPTPTAELLDNAAGVDPNGRTAHKQTPSRKLDKLESEALNNSVTLLGDRAEKQSKTIKSLAKSSKSTLVHLGTPQATYFHANNKTLLLSKQRWKHLLKTVTLQHYVKHVCKVAQLLEIGVDQEMLTRLLACRNSGTMKVKGGFDLQNDPSLAECN